MTYDPTYQPFPERELTALLGWHTQAARGWKEGSRMRAEHEQRAETCRNALASFAALRERMMVAEMNLGQAMSRLNQAEVNHAA